MPATPVSPAESSGEQFLPGIPAAVCHWVLIYLGLFLNILGLIGKVQDRKALILAIRPHPLWPP